MSEKGTDGKGDLKWVKREEIEVLEQPVLFPGRASSLSSSLTKPKEQAAQHAIIKQEFNRNGNVQPITAWHVPQGAAAAVSVEKTKEDLVVERKGQKIAAGADDVSVVSAVRSDEQQEKHAVVVHTPRSQRRIQQQQVPADEQVVRVKIEPPEKAVQEEGSSSCSHYHRSASPKRMRRDRPRERSVPIKTEPMDPDEPIASGSSSSGGSAELGAIRQLLATLQKPVDDDQVFGEHVASELRSIRNISVKKRLKRTIMMAIINALEDDSFD